MKRRQRAAHFLSDEAIEELERVIAAEGIGAACSRLGTSQKSLRSWLCRGQSINRTHRARIRELLGEDAVV